MTFADLSAGESIFVGANMLSYPFQGHSVWSAACSQLFRNNYPAGSVWTTGEQRLSANSLLSDPEGRPVARAEQKGAL
jgi:hypothetical protein